MGKGSGSTRKDNGRYVMSEVKAQELRDNGWSLRRVNADSYNNGVMSGFDLNKYDSIVSEIANDFAVGDIGKQLIVDNNGISTLNIKSDKLEDDGRAAFQIMREIYKERGKLVVEHSIFKMPENMQKQGISKRVNGFLMQQYKKMGIEEIKLRANDRIGGYTWAQYGFSVRSKYDALGAISHASSKDKMLYWQAEKVIHDFYKDKSPSTPFPMRLISGMNGGKKLLLGSTWNGFIDMSDSKSVKIFENYVLR